jgi:hypothetical protein
MKIGETADMTPSDVLRAAADKIINDGWCQEEYGDLEGDGPVCVLGAIRAATGKFEDGRWSDLFAKRIGSPYLHQWNDRPHRTADEVIALLLTVADELESP